MQIHTFRQRLVGVLGLVLFLGVSASSTAKTVVEDGVKDPESNYSTLNQSLRVGRNVEVGDLDAVNGSIRVGSDSVVGRIDSVNGGVNIASGVQAISVKTVNGGIDLDGGVVVERDVESVNGGINMRGGGQIGGDVNTVNGRVRLDDVKLSGSITSYNGEISLHEGTEVFGEITIKQGRNNGFFKRDKPTVVSIGANVVVHGDLYFEKSVELHIDDSATIGEIHGQEFIKNEQYK